MKKLTARFITALTAIVLSFQFALPVNAAPAVSKNLTDIADACSAQATCETGRYGGGIYAHMETLSLASMDGLKWLPGSELE